MKRAIVFSNYGAWDTNNIGFVMVTDFNEADKINELKRICCKVSESASQDEVDEIDNCFELLDLTLVNQVLGPVPSGSSAEVDDDEVLLYHWLNGMTVYTQQPFDCAACVIASRSMALFVGLIFIN